MSDSKKPSGASRSPKKKPRARAPETAELETQELAPEAEPPISIEATLPAPEEVAAERDEQDDDLDDGDDQGEIRDDRESPSTRQPTPVLGDRQRNDDEDDFEEERGAAPRDRDNRDRGPQGRDRDRGRDRDSRREPQGPRSRPTDEYLVQVYFDRGARHFVAAIAEFPDLRATGPNKDAVLRDLDNKLQNHIQNLRRRNEPVPEGIGGRRYPELLEVKISQNLSRRLDVLSRTEKVSIDQLAGELLASALEKRTAPRHEPPQRNQNQGGGRHRDRDNASPGNSRHQQSRHQPRQGGGGRRSANYHETMDSRENFMEYVRNLEKGNWRKK